MSAVGIFLAAGPSASQAAKGQKGHKVGMTTKGKYCVERKVGPQWKRYDDKSFATADEVQEYIDRGLRERARISEGYLFGKAWNKRN